MRLVAWRFLACLAFCCAASGADWPRFQGPDGNGTSPEKGLARSWPAGGPKLLWTADVSDGFAGPAIADGKVYMLDRIEDRQDMLRCFDLESGKELWTFAYDAPGGLPYHGSRTTPTVENGRVYTTGAFGHVHCIDLATHKPIWSKNIVWAYSDRRLPRKLDTGVPRWGFTQHPVIHKDWLLVAPHSITAGLVALDKNTGGEVWRSRDIGRNIYSHVTPYVATLCGVPQVITIGIKDGGKDPPAVISGIDLRDGTILWQIETWKRLNVPIPQPAKIADDTLFFTGGYQIGCFALKLSPPKDAKGRWSVDYAFRDNDAIGSHVHNVVFYNGHIYGQSFDKFHSTVHNGLTCIDPAGNIKWKTGPDVVFDCGGFLIADGLIFVMHGGTGELVLAEATEKGYHQLSRAKIFAGKGKMIWGPLALSNGRLVLRNQNQMKCLDVRK